MNAPDSAIEAAAEALRDNWPSAYAPQRLARAAIEAAMPAICEAIAQEIDTAEYSPDEDPEFGAGVAAAIRIVRGGTP